MLHAVISIIIGLAILAWSADRLVTGASAAAKNLGIPPLLIGLTIIALGTSAPEIFVAIAASLKGNAALAIGNTIGSNIANIGLVLGLTAVICPLYVNSQALRREYPIQFLIMLLVLVLMLDGIFDRLDALFLIVALVIFMTWLIWMGVRKSGKNKDPLKQEVNAEIPKGMPTLHAIGWMIVGLIILPFASKLLVDGAVDIAKIFGISDLVIGLTVVAIGTSLPELSASLAGALKNEPDIAVGNILGSNIFNLLAVLPIPGLISPSHLDRYILIRDLPAMFTFTIILFITAYGFRGPGHVNRYEGSFLLLLYFGYIGLLYYTTH